MIHFRPYQESIFWDNTTGVLLLHWSRQIGKSYTLAAWAVYRLLTRPGRLVTVLSNSRNNGAEFVTKVTEICVLLGQVMESIDLAPHETFDNMRMECRIKVKGKTGRIIVLAANPRTARGFSGDLILDEFAFHENSAAIWEAAEPILSSNPDFLCRISSTGNGKHNLFYQFATSGEFPVSRVPRSLAFAQGVKVYHAVTRKPVTPDEARAAASDKRAYDQNYECAFADENMALLSHDLINGADDPLCGVICEEMWSPAAVSMLYRCIGPLYFGFDVGRNRDLSVISVIERLGRTLFVRAVLRLENMRLPAQQERLAYLFSLPRLTAGCIDMTGLGLGLCEYAQDKYGQRIRGINFASTVPLTKRLALEGRKKETVRVTEAMATQLLSHYEDRSIRHPTDTRMRDDLRKPERIVSPGGNVSIAATRDEAGHADHFWSLALAVHAMEDEGPDFACTTVQIPGRPRLGPAKGILI
jgi:phage FluMu gp28-like protein